MKINTQRLKRRWRWYAAYIVIFILSFALFDCAQNKQTEQMFKEIRRPAMSHDHIVVTSIADKDEVPAFDQADLNRENHK
ncbi:hypothetical protein [Acinetobacter oleivorans]|uniref:hypothetical protein n=1 Tax=Acinetobacter oleivorans TaxID=1148157 RepID=UPI00190153EF|nr:hypothetical protein [Acinetobacter oleivorans]MBJ8496997.1 hypothetical protein [Acinetobacter oleivorans]